MSGASPAKARWLRALRPVGLSAAPTKGLRASARRRLVALGVAWLCLPRLARAERAEDAAHWIAAAEQMKRLALSWGDQPYGAVLVKDGRIIGYGPSRVVRHRDDSAHAEREAIRDALAQRDAATVRGAVLYSTSRPCLLCEAAAARAGVARMVFGTPAQDAGVPRTGPLP